MVRVILPDGNSLEYTRRVTPLDVAGDIGKRLAKATLAAELDGRLVGCNETLPVDGEVRLRLVTAKDPEALGLMRHSCAHVMARAVMRLFEGVQLAFGPTIENGFYYDFLTEKPISDEDFTRIEAEMRKIAEEDEPFERVVLPRDEAVSLCQELGQKLKVEHIKEGLGDQETVSFYRQGEFVDLCRGPHVPSAGKLGAFKLLSVAGAYWKGDSNRE
ncbi:MAG: TGS domain-containing protein, partial [Patescibacteria group bacterium]|nr:TGS domain-containing protein [Patescibacteria group bacterium]